MEIIASCLCGANMRAHTHTRTHTHTCTHTHTHTHTHAHGTHARTHAWYLHGICLLCHQHTHTHPTHTPAAGMPPAVFAAAVPNNYQRAVKELVVEVQQENMMMVS